MPKKRSAIRRPLVQFGRIKNARSSSSSGTASERRRPAVPQSAWGSRNRRSKCGSFENTSEIVCLATSDEQEPRERIISALPAVSLTHERSSSNGSERRGLQINNKEEKEMLLAVACPRLSFRSSDGQAANWTPSASRGPQDGED